MTTHSPSPLACPVACAASPTIPPRRAVIGVDPDGKHTAACVLWSDGAVDLLGGGTRADGAPLCTCTGALTTLRTVGLDALAGVYVETQNPHSPWSAAVEPCRRSRYLWEAACELTASTLRPTAPQAWQRVLAKVAAPYKQTSSLSDYGPLADALAALLGAKLANGDQRAAFGLALFGAHSLGWDLGALGLREQ
jgi:hypothetical protein